MPVHPVLVNTPCSIGMPHMTEYTCCSSCVFERPIEKILHAQHLALGSVCLGRSNPRPHPNTSTPAPAADVWPGQRQRRLARHPCGPSGPWTHRVDHAPLQSWYVPRARPVWLHEGMLVIECTDAHAHMVFIRSTLCMDTHLVA